MHDEKDNNVRPDIIIDEYTDFVYDSVCFKKPINPTCVKDIEESIGEAIEINKTSAFLRGIAERFNELGIECTVNNADIMKAEIVRRFKEVLHKECPKAVTNWFKGVVPGVTNRINNYDVCYALEMDFEETYMFFQKAFLTQPFNCKGRVDAIFLYCLANKKDYSVAEGLLARTESYEACDNPYTASNEIFRKIIEIKDDNVFLNYLKGHVFSNEQSYLSARKIINDEIEVVKKNIINDSIEDISVGRLNSRVIEEVLGYRYQSSDNERILKDRLPREFTQSLPNDVTLGQIINGKQVSYELLRKSLILFKFYNFYLEAQNTDDNTIAENLMDFYDEVDKTLLECGFAQLYPRHPFDALILYCANSYDPILTLQYLNEYGRNPDL